ncbi:MAG: RDD family protein [Bacteroidales bacterium]
MAEREGWDVKDGQHPDVALPDDEPMPPTPAPVVVANPAGPWSRFFARQIDFMVFGSLAWLVLGAVFPSLASSPALSIPVVAGFLTIPLALLIEVPVMAMTGGTLGKLVFGITVRQGDGSKLAMAELFRRNWMLWVHGLGLAIPLVNLFFLSKSYQAAKEGKRSRWDEIPLHDVRQKPIGRLRWAGSFAVFLALLIGLAALDKIESQPTQTMSTTAAKAPAAVTWVNPLTNGSTVLYSGWHSPPEKVKDNPNVFLFVNANSAVLLSREVVPAAPGLVAYTATLQANVDFGDFEDKKVETDAEGMTYHILSYRKAADGTQLRIDVKVWQTTPTNYWRVAVFSPLNNETERAEAHAFAGMVEKTSLVERANSGKRD